MKNKRIVCLLLIAMLMITNNSYSQQGNTLFFLHSLPEANFINPAVQIDCKLFIGVPVISSVYFNYGNSAFSFNQIYDNRGSQYYFHSKNLLKTIDKRNYTGIETHINLISVGYRYHRYYFTFNISEKVNLPFFANKETVSLILDGNSQFEGENASTRGTGINFNYYREYSIGISKKIDKARTFGIKGKLLFGKLNFTTRTLDLDLFTEDYTFNLTFDGIVQLNNSFPVLIEEDANGIVENIDYDESYTISRILLNRKNWGIAFDAGFIYHHDNRITVSGSILDLGFIGWRTNPNRFLANTSFEYDGIANDPVDENYIADLGNDFIDSLELNTEQRSYYNILPLRYYVGATYKLNEYYNIGILHSGMIYRYKYLAGLTFSLNSNLTDWFTASASYSLIFGSYNNIGLGIQLGKSPLQFYAVSDNINAFFWPLSTRNINLRFGVNLNLGCRNKYKEDDDSEYGSLPCPKLDSKRTENRYKKVKRMK